MLIEKNLFGTIDKVDLAIRRLREFEPPEGYYLAFSGGKDSVCIKALADMAGVKYDAHYNLVGIDPPELVYFIRKHHTDVVFERQDETFWQMFLRKKFPPIRTQRWCCRLMKEGGGADRLIVTGVRWAESVRRQNRKMFEFCARDKSKKYLHPIIDWEEEDVWQFIRENNLPYCKLYDEGFERLGCLMCPAATDAKRKRDAERYPRMAKAFVRIMQKLIDLRREAGNPFKNWETGQEMFDWWMNIPNHGAKKEDERQLSIFE